MSSIGMHFLKQNSDADDAKVEFLHERVLCTARVSGGIRAKQIVRDGYLVHDNQATLKNIVLPLVLSQPCLDKHGCLNASPRQLVILDRLPDCASGLPNLDAKIVYIRNLEDLTREALRQYLKMPGVCAYIQTDMLQQLLHRCLVERNIGRIDAKIQQKHLRGCFSTVLSDLPWDRVITCCVTSVVRMPPGHDIGFWWTLCGHDAVTAHAAPLSTVTVNGFRGAMTKQRLKHWLNRHRMIDLTHASN